MKSHASMNRIYRLIWSQALNSWVPVAENAKGRGKSGTSRNLVAGAVALTGGLFLTPFAQAAPDGGQVVSGTGSIAQSGATTTINQASQNLSLNWQSFNIAPAETVNFVQPSASAIAVNRIFDTNGTQILGRLNANGQVYLINPNGILFGQGAQVNVGALVASTLDFNDASLNSSSKTFGANGVSSTGSIVNQGTINATGTGGTGGYVALLGNTVSNQGTITAPQGTVALGAGSAVTLNFNGNSLVNMQIDQSVLNTLAENGGLIKADGGIVLMSAGAKDALLASVVNNTGVIEARTVENHEGTIILMGGMTAGTTYVSGTLDASAPNGGNGGFIETSAAHVKIADDVKITTAAANGKTGTWLIDPVDFTIAASSGDITGAALGTLLADNSITIQTATSPTATATNLIGGTGTNGDIFVNDAVSWSAGTTLTLDAFRNININQSITASGATGKLALLYGQGSADGVIDTVVSSYNVNAAVNLSAGPNFSTKLGSGGAVKAYTVITSLGAAGSITTTDLQGMSGNLALNYALGSNIDAAATSGWNSDGAATPSYAGFAAIGSGLYTQFTGTFDGLGHTISNLTINRPTTKYVGLFGVAGSSSVIQNVGLVGGSVTGREYVGGLVGENEGGTISNSYATGTVSGERNVGGLVGYGYGTISNSYATGNVTGTGYYAGGLVGYGYGTISNSYATGSVTGVYFVGGLVGGSDGTISNSYATGSVSGVYFVGGLAGAGSTISNSYATGAVSGTNSVGGLVGVDNYGTISNSYYNIDTVDINGVKSHVTPYGLYNAQYLDWVSDKALSITDYASLSLTNGYYQISNVQGLKDLLGFAGNATYKFRLAANLNLADIKLDLDSAITSGWHIPIFAGAEFDGAGHVLNNLAVNQPKRSNIGFIGSLASGSLLGNLGLTNVSVTGGNSVGGLVGYNRGTISNSYVTGTVTGTSWSVGGLAGLNNGGTISNSYATGAVSGTSSVGGLAGENDGGTISNSYATGAVSGTNSVGGLVGYNYGYVQDGNSYGTISNSYATGKVSGTGDNVGGLVGENYEGTISNSYATGAVSGTNSVGGLAGYSFGGTITNGYWNTSTSGQAASAGGGVGLTSAQMLQQSNFTGFDFTNTWIGYDGYTNPLLRVFMTPLTVTANNDSKTYNGTAYTGGNGISYSSSNLLGTPSYGGTSQNATNAGSYTITPSGLYSNQQGYIISYVNGNLTIAKANAVVTANSDTSKVYTGLAQSVSGFSVSGLVNGETATVLSGVSASGSGTNAGSYSVVASGTDGNYNLSFVNGTLTINNPAPTVESAAPAPALNAIAQLQSAMLRFEMQMPKPSTTFTQTQIIGTVSDTASDTVASESGQGAVADVTMSIGNQGSTLKIAKGGMRLPVNMAKLNKNK